MTEEQINQAIARIILSTKRKSRQYSLYEIGLDVENLKKAKGNIKAVANLIGISSGMLNQFLSVFKLPQSVIELVKNRKIDSVSLVHNLSKLSEKDISELSDLLLNNKLTSQELKVLLPYRKQHPDESIMDLLEKMNASKNIKVSVVRINQTDTSKSIPELKNTFSNLVGSDNVIDILVNGNYIDIKFSKSGENILRKTAKRQNRTLLDLITNLIASS